MKIAVYHNLGSGGAKKALFYIVKGLHSKGHVLDVYTTSLADHDFYDLKPHVNIYHIEKVPFSTNESGNGLFGILRKKRNLKLTEGRIAEIINGKNYDAAFVANCRYFQHPNILRLLKTTTLLYSQEILRGFYDIKILDRLYRQFDPPKKSLLSPLSSIVGNWLSNYWAKIDKNNISAISEDNILVNSYFSRESFVKAYGVSPRVCYLGTERESKPMDWSARGNYVLSIGGFEPHKGHDWVIRSLARIEAAIRPELVIIGDRGSEKYMAELQRLAQVSGVQLNIERSIDDLRVKDYYRKAKLTICASWLEPFGFAPIESQACGTPVVAVREGGLRETVVDGIGGITCDREVEQLASAITRLLKDSKLWQSFSISGAKFVAERFSWEKTVNRIESALIKIAR